MATQGPDPNMRIALGMAEKIGPAVSLPASLAELI
jgi:hypothetical protein